MKVNRAAAMATLRGFPELAVRQFRQAVDAFLGDDQDTAATSAISAVGAAAWNEPLATKADTAGSAVAGQQIDFDTVDEHEDTKNLVWINKRVVVHFAVSF